MTHSPKTRLFPKHLFLSNTNAVMGFSCTIIQQINFSTYYQIPCLLDGNLTIFLDRCDVGNGVQRMGLFFGKCSGEALEEGVVMGHFTSGSLKFGQGTDVSCGISGRLETRYLLFNIVFSSGIVQTNLYVSTGILTRSFVNLQCILPCCL